MKKYVFESLKFFCAAILCTILSAFTTPALADLDPCRNLFDMDWLLKAPGWTKNGDVYSGSADTMWSTYTSGGQHFPMTFATNTQYTFSGHVGANPANARFSIMYTDGTDYKLFFGIDRDFSYTSSAGKTISSVVFGNAASGNIQLSNIQVEEGTTATAYTPYNPLCATCDGTIVNYTSATGTGVQNGTPTPDNPIEPVFYQQGNMVLRKVGDYADTYDATTGKITRRVGVKVLDGTENWQKSSNYTGGVYLNPRETYWVTNSAILCTHFEGMSDTNHYARGKMLINNGYLSFWYGTNADTSVDDTKTFLASQYAAGTPVTVWYPLAEETTEDWPASYCETPIKIATTKYNESAFGPLNTALQNAISVVDSVVSNTITQAGRIATLQAQKQTRPNDIADDNEKCPAGKKCLLVTDTAGVPHWYEIFDPIHEWYDAWVTAGKPAVKAEMDGSNYSFYNAFYRGDKTWRKTYIDGTTSTYDRPFDHATRCTNPSYNTETQKARPCYSEVGMFKTLGDGEWAEVYTSDDGTNSPVGVVYGTSKCTSVAGPTNYTGGGTLLSQLSAADQAKWAELPALHGQPEREGYDSESFKQCWCKVDGVGVPGADGNPANGSIYPVGSSSWVFNDPYGSAAICANLCAYVCAYHVRDVQGFRSVLFGM